MESAPHHIILASRRASSYNGDSVADYCIPNSSAFEVARGIGNLDGVTKYIIHPSWSPQNLVHIHI